MEQFDKNFGHVLTIEKFHNGKTWFFIMNNDGTFFERKAKLV